MTDSVRESYLRLTGSPIELDLRPYRDVLDRINAVDVSQETDAGLRARIDQARVRAGQGDDDALNALLPEVYAVVREACGRVLGMRPFDVQMMAASALHRGRVAQLATGEGKTLVAVLPVVLNALAGRGVHVFTANDYLARRDAQWMGPVYQFLGLRAGAIGQGMSREERRATYGADVTYVTAKEAGFDFLRDHTAASVDQLVLRPFHYVIVDEADFILIDEARVPLVIAGQTAAPPIDHRAIASLVRQLRAGVDYRTDEYARNVTLTDAGLARIEARLGIKSLHDPGQQMQLSSVNVALHAETLLHRDRDYIVRDGRVELVDELTGRVADNRRWPHGIQPAVEAKEDVEVQVEGTVLGSIPIQHFVRLWPKLAGMTATAVPSADELMTFYGLATTVFPPNRPCRRVDEADVIFTHQRAKIAALVAEIATVHETGRPVLVGTASVRESEELAAVLERRHIACRVLNARHDEREAAIVAQAGTLGAVTISTNMAGRGTDIVLGGGDASSRDRIAALGGLYVIGTNRHESRRIDDQLRGRAGRQGDPGCSRFFISLEDDLVRRYGVVALIPPRHRPAPQDPPIEDIVVRREIARAQRIIEGQNFEIRKTLWQYSTLVDTQRRVVYDRRQSLLRGEGEIHASVCAEDAPEQYARLGSLVGLAEVRRAEHLLTLRLLDRRWSEHLALIEDIREGIHLQRYGGLEPLQEFHKQIVNTYAAMMERLREDVVSIFMRLSARDGLVDLDRAGVRGPSSTWTYLVNDNPFSTFGVSLIAGRNIGFSAGLGLVAVLSWPISIAVAASVLVRRWLKRSRGTGLDLFDR